jgi:hypothetical protein
MTNDMENDGLGLLSENHQVDETINLEGLVALMAIAKVDRTLKETKGAKIWFKFPLANGIGETLFAPIGNHLRNKLKEGKIIRVMPSSLGGWIVRIR